MLIEIKRYESCYLKEVTTLFYETIHSINLQDYTQEQVNAWATGSINLLAWDESLTKNYSLVALENEKVVGFGDITQTNYLDRLFVHKNYQHKKIATRICDELENQAERHTITVHASITAKPFFEKRGYKIIKEQQIERNKIFLTNYIMEKNLPPK